MLDLGWEPAGPKEGYEIIGVVDDKDEPEVTADTVVTADQS